MKVKFTIYLTVSIGLLALSLAPLEAPVSSQLPTDKILHFATYGGLAGLAYWLASSDREYVFTCAYLVAFGALIEVLQGFVPNRQGSGLDLLANATGVVLAALFLYTLYGSRLSKEES